MMNMALHFNDRLKETACSSQDSFAYNESLQHPTCLWFTLDTQD